MLSPQMPLMEVKNVTLHRAKCKTAGCRFDVKLHETIADGEARIAECPDGHLAEYRLEDVRSWTSEVYIGRD